MKLLLVLSEKNWQEMREGDLAHDGGGILKWMLKRLSLPRDAWTHTYAYNGNKKTIPKKAWERKKFLESHRQSLAKFIEVNMPCVVIAMGKLAREALMYPPVSKKKEGTAWTSTISLQRLGIPHIWCTYMPDAALYDPALTVDITRIFMAAAQEAGITTKIDYTLKAYHNWYRFWK